MSDWILIKDEMPDFDIDVLAFDGQMQFVATSNGYIGKGNIEHIYPVSFNFIPMRTSYVQKIREMINILDIKENSNE